MGVALPPAPRRIVVVGTTGSGKTTLAHSLSRHLGIPHVELDALHWRPGWVEAPIHEFRAEVARATGVAEWVLDGNYSKVRDVVWPRANALIWLDYSLAIILWRLFFRTWRRIWRRERLWNDNRETWQGTFFSRDSLFLWALRTHWARRKRFAQTLSQPEYAHLAVLHFRTPQQTRHWLEDAVQGSGCRKSSASEPPYG
jgi:adenylate kinase family enzyme